MKGKKRSTNQRAQWLVNILILVTVFATAYALILPAVTMTSAQTYCQLEEHQHTEECEPDCQLTEHIHTLQCESNPEADVETAQEWLASLNGADTLENGRTRLVEVARSQIGYTRSAENFQVDEEGVQHFYSRYGAWAEVPYTDDWDLQFVRFCMDHAGVADENAFSADSFAEWKEQALNQKRLTSDFTKIHTGDILFVEKDQEIQNAGIVLDVTPETVLYVTADAETVQEKEAENGSNLSWNFVSVFPEEEIEQTALPAAQNESLDESSEAVNRCGFTHDISPYVVSGALEYRRAGTSEWHPYDETILLHYNDALRLTVNYANLTKSDISAADGMFAYALPDFMKISNSSAQLVHKDGGSEIILGICEGCSLENHLHIHMSEYEQLSTDISTGTFYVQAVLDYQKLDNVQEESFKIGDTNLAVGFEDIKPENYSALSVDKELHETKDAQGDTVLEYTVTMVSGDVMVPDVLLDDFFIQNLWMVERQDDSFIASWTTNGETTTKTLDLRDENTILFNLTNSAVSHSFGSDPAYTHDIPAQGFTWIVGDVPPNTTVQLQYKYKVNSEKLKGGQFTLPNDAEAFSKTQSKGKDSASDPIAANANVSKTETSFEQLPNGDLRLSYKVDVSLPADAKYVYRDLWIDDEMNISDTAGMNKMTYRHLLEYARLDKSSVKLNGTQLSLDKIHEAVNLQTGNTFHEEANSTSREVKGFRFFVGDLAPGQHHILTYDVILDKDVLLGIEIMPDEAVRFSNQALVRRSTTNDDGDSFSYTTGSWSTRDLHNLDLLSKRVVETLDEPSAINLQNETVYNTSGQQLAAGEAEIPEGSSRYNVLINKQGYTNVDAAEFIDQLSENGDTENVHMAYSGYVKVDIFENTDFACDEQNLNVVSTFYIQVDPNQTCFTFEPQRYEEAVRLEKEEAPYNGYRLTYCVTPRNTDELGSAMYISNDISTSNLGIGIGGAAPIRVQVRSQTRLLVSGNNELSAKKAGVYFSLSPEDDGSGYTNGHIYWLVQVDANYIPKDFTLIDEIIDCPESSGAQMHKFLANSLIGIYRSTDDMSAFGGMDALAAHGTSDSYHGEFDLDALKAHLEADNSQITDYTVTYDHNTNDRRMLIHFPKRISLQQQEGSKEYLYLLIQTSPTEPLFGSQNSANEFHTGQKTNNYFSNSLKYSPNGQDEFTLVSNAEFLQRQYYFSRKFWLKDFVFQDGGFKTVARNTSVLRDGRSGSSLQLDLNTLSNSVWDTLYSHHLNQDELEENTLYSSWFITANLDKGTDTSWPDFSGTFEFVETLPDNSEIVTVFASSPDLQEVHAPQIVSITPDPWHADRIRIVVENAPAVPFSIHVVTRSTLGWDELLQQSVETPDKTAQNKVSIYHKGIKVGSGIASHPCAIPGILDKQAVSSESDVIHGSGTLEYCIELNEKQVDLIENSSRIDLEDTFSAGQMTILQDTLNVVYASRSGQPAVEGYTVSFSQVQADGSQVMSIKNLPDDAHLRITYTVMLMGKPTDPAFEVTNAVSWNGKGRKAPTVSETRTYRFNLDAISVGSTQDFTFQKVDRLDARHFLSGAEFELYHLIHQEDDQFSEEKMPQTYTTDENGMFSQSSVSNQYILTDELYKFTEIKAPDHYVLDQTPIYVYFQGAGTSQTPSWLPPATVVVMSGNQAQLQAMNNKNVISLDVHKSFSDRPIPGTYLFGLYDHELQENDDSEPLATEVLTLSNGNSEDQAVCTFTDLIKEGSYYIYELDPQTLTPLFNGDELLSDTQTFTVVYPDGYEVNTDEGSLESGYSITIQNKPQYSLPRTGSTGEGIYVLSSAACFGAAAWLIFKDRRKCI